MKALKESLWGRRDDSGLGMKMRSRGNELEVSCFPPEYSELTRIEGNFLNLVKDICVKPVFI